MDGIVGLGARRHRGCTDLLTIRERCRIMSALMPMVPTFSDGHVAPNSKLTMARLRRAGLGAFFRPMQLRATGIDYDGLQRLVKLGSVEKVGRGLYHLQSAEPTERYDLAAACARVPHGIICLLSALQVHEIGSQVPRDVWMAIHHKARAPNAGQMRLRLVRFSGAALRYGVVDTQFEGVPAQITTLARTIVDCFRFERQIGREAAMEALREALRLRLVSIDELYRALDALPSRRLRTVLEVTAP